MLPRSIASIVVIIFSLLTLASAAGKVINHTPYEMKYTTNPNAAGAPYLCAFWNWEFTHFKRVSCTQEPLAPGDSRGGGSIDVDGFSYANYDYYTPDTWRTRGTWTKLNDLMTIECHLGRARGRSGIICGV